MEFLSETDDLEATRTIHCSDLNKSSKEQKDDKWERTLKEYLRRLPEQLSS
jgi:hypothetical protein